jgi:hypothetical protein
MSYARSRFGVLALVALGALGAFAVPSASAVNIDSESATTYLTGDVGVENIFTFWAGTAKCKEFNLKNGTSFSGDPVSIDVEPVYGNCTIFGQKSTIDFNGCKYRLAPSTTTTGGLGIVCPAGQHIVFTVGDPNVICTIAITEQVPSFPIVDQTAGTAGGKADVSVTSTVTGIAYTSSNSLSICGTSGVDGKLTGSFTVTGFSNSGHTTRTGVSII